MISLPSLLTSSGFTAPVLRKALSLAVAAGLSFAIAALLHVHNAYWAAMPVWVLTQPSRGLVLERALYRVLGTLVGAAVGFALVHIPASPYLLLALLAIWMALNAGLTHVLRGVTGYICLLSGITAAVVVIPSVLHPDVSMDVAVARAVCTLIGVVVSTFVLALLTPDSQRQEFYAQIRAVAAEAVGYAARMLRSGLPDEREQEERRILGLITQLDASARLNAAGSVTGYRRLADVDLLVVGSLSAMAASQALRDSQFRHDQTLPTRLEQIARHLQTEGHKPLTMEERIIDQRGEPELTHLDVAIGQILDAEQVLSRAPETMAPLFDRQRVWLAPHREWPQAFRTGLLAGIAAFLGTATAVWLQWPPLELTALGICTFVMVLGSLPLPQVIAPKLVTGVAIGAGAGLLYRILLQPQVSSLGELLLSLVPFLLLGGLMRSHPRTSIPGVDANMCFWLASQAGMPASGDLSRIVIDSVALAVAAGTMASAFLLLPGRVQKQAQDAVTLLRRDLWRILDSTEKAALTQWQARSARQILRLTLHLSRARVVSERWPSGLLAVLNLGQTMLDLQQQGMPEAVRILLNAMLQQQMSPRQTADALQALAVAERDETLSRLIGQLADTLNRSTGLLTFDTAPQLTKQD